MSPSNSGVWRFASTVVPNMIVVLLLLIAIMNRITLHSESAHQMHTRELVFEPFDANAQRDKGVEPVLLRAKKELLEPDSKWYVS